MASRQIESAFDISSYTNIFITLSESFHNDSDCADKISFELPVFYLSCLYLVIIAQYERGINSVYFETRFIFFYLLNFDSVL